MVRRLLAAAVALCSTSLSACAAAGGFTLPAQAEYIAIEPSPPPFCGRCESTKIVAFADDTVWLETGYWAGAYSDWRVRREKTRAAPGGYRRLATALAPHRPRGQATFAATPPCTSLTTDGGSIRITWNTAGGKDQLQFDLGCEVNGSYQVRDTLLSAHELLDLAGSGTRQAPRT